ncbi:MAG: hypothetical protein OXL37_10670 [Chloroflexota bacterium]|nr:hypothetical protein [Chloroflexota bacterium]MDE2960613.1 hypothetical protein [Chloroflexota bacterium]
MRERSPATLTPSAQLGQLVRRLEQLRSVPEGERWPTSELPDAAFRDAKVFLDRLPFPLVALPHISLADDGEVNFAWDCEGMHIGLGFYGSGTFSYYARGSDGREHYRDDVSASHPLPADLELLLRA